MAFRWVRCALVAERGQRNPPGFVGRVAAVALALCLSSLAGAQSNDSHDGTSSTAAEQAARQSIPWKALSHQDRRLAYYVVRDHSVFRRMPTRVIPCHPDVFTFLAKNPEVVSGVWNVMGISKLQITRLGEGQYRAVDNAGTQGAMRVLHADWGPEARNRIVIYAEGVYEAKPLPNPIKARSLLVLQSASTTGADGEPYVTTRLDSFIRFERATADFVAKTLQPLINKTADHNFAETMKFVSTFSQTRDRNPEGMARLAGRLDNVGDDVRSELVTLCRKSKDGRVKVALAPSGVR